MGTGIFCNVCGKECSQPSVVKPERAYCSKKCFREGEKLYLFERLIKWFANVYKNEIFMSWNGIKDEELKREQITEFISLQKICLDNRDKCVVCGQVDEEQTGEYPCPWCGLPMVHDAKEAE